jgi:hypothetical protein
MFPRSRILMPLALIVAVAACSKSTETSPTSASPAPSGAASSSAVTATPAAPAPVAAASEPTQGFTLTMAGVDAYLGAMRNLARLAEKNPEIDDLTSMNASNENTTQFAARLRRNPQAVAAITSAGLSPEEFAQTGEALVVGMMTAGALESGALKKIPDGIDPQFVDFAKQNKAALAAKFKTGQAQ